MAFKTKSASSGKSDPVGTALGLSDGENIDLIEGKLTGLFPIKTAGRSTVQNGELETEHGKIKVAFWGTDLPMSLKGKNIAITATEKKFGSITYKIEEFDGKAGHVRQETLSVGNNADIEEAGGTSQGAAQEASRHGMERTSAPARQSTSGFSLAEAAESLVEQHMVVHDMVHLAYAKKGLTNETLQAYIATLWIALDRAGIIVIGQQLRQDARQAPSSSRVDYNPQDWASAIVPDGSMKGQKLGAIGKAGLTKFNEYRITNDKSGGFWDCVEQAASDMQLGQPTRPMPDPDDRDDDIPF